MMACQDPWLAPPSPVAHVKPCEVSDMWAWLVLPGSDAHVVASRVDVPGRWQLGPDSPASPKAWGGQCHGPVPVVSMVNARSVPWL